MLLNDSEEGFYILMRKKRLMRLCRYIDKRLLGSSRTLIGNLFLEQTTGDYLFY